MLNFLLINIFYDNKDICDEVKINKLKNVNLLKVEIYLTE